MKQEPVPSFLVKAINIQYNEAKDRMGRHIKRNGYIPRGFWTCGTIFDRTF